MEHKYEFFFNKEGECKSTNRTSYKNSETDDKQGI